MRGPALLLAALAAALLPGAAAGEVRVEGGLHLRLTGVRDAPATGLLFDAARRAFLIEDYLATTADSRHGSTVATLSFDGRHLDGALRWRVALDTGELRVRRLPGLAEVCYSDSSPSGLDVRGSGGCWLPTPTRPSPTLLLEETGLGPAELTSNGRPLGEEVRQTLLVREAYAAFSLGRAGFATVRASRVLAGLLSSELDSTASMAWLGSSGSLSTFAGQRALWTVALLRGRVDRLGGAAAPAEVDIPLRGSAAWLRYRVSPWPWLQVTPWFLYLSGDRPPPEKRRLGLPQGYGAFLGVTPYVTATNLFFRGGLSETFAARQATAPGVNGRGVIAPGLDLQVDAGPDVDLEARVAWLQAEDAGPWGGRRYGAEVDLSARWEATRWLSLGAELDVLWPGDFFGGGATVYKTVLAVDLLTP